MCLSLDLEEMSSTIDGSGGKNEEGVPKGNNLRKKLALAVKSIQWSYAIFWSISSENPGVLEWFDGYYNGDIKTRKTVQAGEGNMDEQGLQRSKQLRELYESLLVGESNPQSKRPSAALSPEDLTDAEWYYLVCMSFTFNIGQGDSLAGRTLKKNQTMWLFNAHQAESKVFSRSLVAKSASIQTVVCFPHVGGVVEVGITEQTNSLKVPEDPNLVQLMKTYLSEISSPSPVGDNTSSHVSENAGNENYISLSKVDNDMLDSSNNPHVEIENILNNSPNNGSSGYETVKLPEDSYTEGLNGEASQVQDDRMEDENASHFRNSANSSDSISQNSGNEEKTRLISNGEKTKSCLHDVQECEQNNINCLDTQQKDIHYHSVLSNLLKSSHQLILGLYFRNRNRHSSFTSWKKDGFLGIQKPITGTKQKLLKKVLLEVSKMHEGTFIGSMKKDEKIETVCQPEAIQDEENCGLSEQMHREKINDRFTILSSLVPTNGKIDKVSILDGTIEYLMELKRRVNELESYKELIPKTRRKPSDASERTSDNYGSNKMESGKRAHTKKRKVGEIDDVEPRGKQSLLGESSSDDILVFMIDKEFLIELKFPSRDGVLPVIMEVMSNFNLDCNAIQSTSTEGILTVTIRSKSKGLKLPSTGKIKEALQRVIHDW